MEIIEIYKPYIYSVVYDNQELDEFHRLFDSWYDINNVLEFMVENQDYLKSSVWYKIPQPEFAVRQVRDEAEELEDTFEDLYFNTCNGMTPDFDSHFHYLDGVYINEFRLVPMKSYGMQRPSLLRIYAIKLDINTYLITGGGIKLADKIQNSPGIKDNVLQDIQKVRKFLIDNGIQDSDDLNN